MTLSNNLRLIFVFSDVDLLRIRLTDIMREVFEGSAERCELPLMTEASIPWGSFYFRGSPISSRVVLCSVLEQNIYCKSIRGGNRQAEHWNLRRDVRSVRKIGMIEWENSIFYSVKFQNQVNSPNFFLINVSEIAIIQCSGETNFALRILPKKEKDYRSLQIEILWPLAILIARNLLSNIFFS